MKNLRLYTACWGEESIQSFKDGALKTLLWPKNKAAIEGSVWDMWTFEKDVEELERTIFNSFDVKFEPHIIPDLINYHAKPYPGLIPYLLHKPMFEEMVLCLNSQSKMLMLPPDTLFGDGTLANILKLGAEPNTCVAVPHLRVFPHIKHDISAKPLSNSELCGLTWNTLHRASSEAEKGHEKGNSFWSGVIWETLDKSLWSVTHRIPTIYLASFNGQDHAQWQKYSAFSAWDHQWPSDCIIRQARQRTPGSSDACMIAEITGVGENIAPQTPPEILQSRPVDEYWNDLLHASHNRQTQMIFRGT